MWRDTRPFYRRNESYKKAILFEIWHEVAERYQPLTPDIHLHLPAELLNQLRAQDLEIVKRFHPNPGVRRIGFDWPPIAHSMIGRVRMENLQQCMQTVLNDNIEGDFIETGVWRGGACIFMRGFLKVNGIKDRSVWVADSFEGLPRPEYFQDSGDIHHTFDFLKVSLEEVTENFRKYDLLDDQVRFLKGWFKDTLPSAPINKIAVLRFDGDMYGSTMDCLYNLYPRVSQGGFIIIDDYCLPNCAAAVNNYRNMHGINDPMYLIEGCGCYWRKMQ